MGSDTEYVMVPNSSWELGKLMCNAVFGRWELAAEQDKYIAAAERMLPVLVANFPAAPSEPVAWRWRMRGSDQWHASIENPRMEETVNWEAQPLYTSPSQVRDGTEWHEPTAKLIMRAVVGYAGGDRVEAIHNITKAVNDMRASQEKGEA